MNELKPCPFCGGEARLRYRKPLGWVQCKKCGATSAAVSDYYEETDGKGQAVAAWNRRAQPENEAIVRCGECKIGGGSDVGGDWVFCKNNQLHHKKDHYCSYGERKPERSEG